jgi:hypothetical protein
VLFLQEVRTHTCADGLPAAFASTHAVHAPARPSRADQNSVVALSLAVFDDATWVDLTAEAMAAVPPDGASVSDGDLLVGTVKDHAGQLYVFASFHGDTDGLATASALAAVHAVASAQTGAVLLFGLDANTYAAPKPKKQADVRAFVADAAAKGYATAIGDAPPETMLTTSIARTFLQPQLQKACKAAEKRAKGDFNPKDHLLFTAGAFTVDAVGRDNQNRRAYDADMVVPTLEWPSDHGLLYATLSAAQAPAELS